MDIVKKIVGYRHYSHSDNWYYSWNIALLVIYNPLVTLMGYLGDHIWFGHGWCVKYILLAVVVFALVIPMVTRIRITLDMVFILAFLIVSFAVSIINDWEHAYAFFDESSFLFVVGFPLYCISKSVLDYEETEKILYKTAIVSLVSILVRMIIGIINNDLFAKGEVYDQAGGVMTSVVCLVFLISYSKRKKKYDFLLFTVSLILSFYYGSRIALLCILIGIILLLFYRLSLGVHSIKIFLSRRYQWIWILLAIIGAIAIYVIFDHASIIPQRSYVKGGRIIQKVLNGTIVSNSGRFDFWKVAIDYIISHPFIGSGIISDRMAIAKSPIIIEGVRKLNDTTPWQGFYAHNVFLEILMQYGGLIGIILCALIIFAVIVLIFDKNRDKRFVSVLVIAETFGILLVSGPSFNNGWLWVMLGMASNTVLNRPKLRNKWELGERGNG